MTQRKTTIDHNRDMLSQAKPAVQTSRFVMDMNDPIIKAAVMTRAHATVKMSFLPELWPMRNPTQNEMQDRFKIAVAGYQVMRDEENTSISQALDSMEFFVEEYLDKQQKASRRGRKRASWLAS